jgi:3-dehydroquinate synthase
VGFVAATLFRGVPYIQIPTTLLAQVDSSVGGKTGVNHRLGKNLIGAFYQPHLVCIDTLTLASLPEREFLAGLYEVLKYGLIYDGDFFGFLADNLEALKARSAEALEMVISRCCEIKAEVIAIDEKEENLRRILNFGHTLGHALEAATEYSRFKHGEAVAYGMLAASRMSVRMQLLDPESLARIEQVILDVGPLPDASDVPVELILDRMQHDKKRLADQTVLVLLKRIGQTHIYTVEDDSVLGEVWQEALERVRQSSGSVDKWIGG